MGFAINPSYDLGLDQRGEHLSGADGIAGDVFLRGLERDHLGQTDQAVCGGHTGRLERLRDQTVRRGDVDDVAPPVVAHGRERAA